jgi:hypothetical protein
MDKKIFIKNRPFDINDANDMQNWTENALKKTMASIYTSGIVNGLAVSVNSALNVNIAVGTAFDTNYDFINVIATQNITLDAAHVTNPRIDKIVIKYQSTTTNNIDTTNIYGLGTTLVYSQNKKDGYIIQVIKGTPAASPVAPATPADAILLAEVTVPANAVSLVVGNIVDRRAYININNNIITPEVVFSATAPGNTNVLWIDTTNALPKIYKNSVWTILKASDADTLDGNHASAFSLAGHDHNGVYYLKSEVYTQTESDNKYLTKANNLSDLTNTTTARANLGLGTAATQNTSAFAGAIHNHDSVYVKGDYILAVSPTAPTADTKTIWWDTTNNVIKRYTTSWVVLNASDAATLGGASKGTGANNILQLDSSGKVPNSNINTGSTSQTGIVQLNDTVTSALTTQAATANAAKTAYDRAITAETNAKNASTPIAHVGTGGAAHAQVTQAVDGFMIALDKVKLDGIATNANNYTHPANHPPSIITQDASNRFVTDTEKATWNSKASTAVATTTVDGLMDSADKVKLDGIATSANNYVHPTGDGNSHVPATGTTNNTKVLKSGATANSAAWGVVNASEVVEDASNRFVSDTEKATWNAKASTAVVTTTTDGLMDNADKVKLDGIMTGADVNQNAFSTIKVGATNIVAELESDTFEIVAGANVAITPDAATDKITIAISDGTTGVKGVVQLVDSVVSTSQTTAATPNSVKAAYDRAVSAETNAKNASLPLVGGTLTGVLSNTGQTYVETENAAVQSIPSKAWTNIGALTASINVGGGWSSGKFTAPTTGVYLVWAQCFYDITVPGDILIQISAVIGAVSYRLDSKVRNGVYDGTLSGSAIVKLTAGDILQIQTYQADTVARNATESFVKILKLT